jgi:hypothetical protein
MEAEELKNLISKVKQNKKYKGLSEEIVGGKILEYAKKNAKFLDYKEKFIVKEIRSMLHKAYGSFQVKGNTNKKREKLLEKLKNNPDNLEVINKILRTNKSTCERLDIYPKIYEKIFEITGKPDIIVDLGCGLNPFSFPHMKIKSENKVKYYAYDINESDKEFLNNFFEIEKDKINGKAELINLQNLEEINKIPKCDVCFMLKLVDVLDIKGHKLSEEIIRKLSGKCKFIVASFATKTITGKNMNFPYRGWIERMLSRVGLKFEKISLSGEIFYVISRN